MFSKRPCSRLGKVICQILTKSFYSLIELSNLGLRSFINRMIMGLGRLFEVELHPSVVIFTTQYLVNPVYHGILRYCENRDKRGAFLYRNVRSIFTMSDGQYMPALLLLVPF